MNKRRYPDAVVKIAVEKNVSIRGVLNDLGLDPSGSNYKSIQAKIKDMGLDISHILGQGWLRGKTHSYTPSRPLDEILVEDSTYCNSNHLRTRLIKAGVFEKKCNRCKGETWQGQDIPLELEHKNGINNDNRLENLELLCPNCHALTSTYRGKNKNHGKRVPIFKLCECGEKISNRNKSGLCAVCFKRSRSVTLRPDRFCDCGAKIQRKNKTGLCLKCAQRSKSGNRYRPPVEVLKKEIEEMGYCATGRKYGVSDNAIRKWIKEL